MARVFVVQEPLKKIAGVVTSRIDLSPAAAYGELVYVFSWSDPHTLSNAEMVWKARRTLWNFTDRDFIVSVGSPRAIGIVACVAADINGGQYRLLDFHRNGGMYKVEAIDINCQPT